MPIKLEAYNVYQPTFQKQKETPVVTATVGLADLDSIPGVDTVNNTITDMANGGKIKSRKFLNIIMTVGLGVAAFFTGKRISKSVLDSVSHSTTYLNPLARCLQAGYKICKEQVKKINVEKGSPFVKYMKSHIVNLPHNLANYARKGIYKDIEQEKFLKEFGLKNVNELSPDLTKIFENKYCSTIVKNGVSKFLASTIGLVTGVETFIEVGADKNKNGIPDLFEQKNGKKIMDAAQTHFEEKVIEQVRKINEDDENETEEDTKELD